MRCRAVPSRPGRIVHHHGPGVRPASHDASRRSLGQTELYGAGPSSAGGILFRRRGRHHHASGSDRAGPSLSPDHTGSSPVIPREEDDCRKRQPGSRFGSTAGPLHCAPLFCWILLSPSRLGRSLRWGDQVYIASLGRQNQAFRTLCRVPVEFAERSNLEHRTGRKPGPLSARCASAAPERRACGRVPVPPHRNIAGARYRPLE